MPIINQNLIITMNSKIKSLFVCAIAGTLVFSSCDKKDDTTATPTTTDSTGGTTGGTTSACPTLADSTVKYGDTAVSMSTAALSQNTFGKPKFTFQSKNADKSISANVEIRGTVPASGDKYTMDPNLGGGTSTIKLYFKAKNWTCKLDTTASITFSSVDTTHTVCGSNIIVYNDKDNTDSMKIDLKLTGNFKFP